MLLKTWRALVLMACMLVATTSAHSASKTLLVLGDSLSAEYGLARGAGWVPLLEQRLKAGKLDVKVVNASISGARKKGTSGSACSFASLGKTPENRLAYSLP